jgi:hypothetical protein
MPASREPKPFWTDGARSLYHGDARRLCVWFNSGKFGSIITDPPYGEGILDEGDDEPKEAAQLLREVLIGCRRIVRPGGHVAFFWANRSLPLAIRAAEGAGLEYKRLLTMHVQRSNARPYKGWLLKTQPIILMRVPGREMPEWRQAVAAAIQEAMAVHGLGAAKIAKALGVSPRLVYKWTRHDDEAWSYPNPVHRAELEKVLGVHVPPPPKADHVSYTDDFYMVRGGEADTLHPCEKPLWVIEDIVRKLGGPVLDPFCGSGTALMAARRCGVEAVGFEIDEAHCIRTDERMRQRELFSLDPDAH